MLQKRHSASRWQSASSAATHLRGLPEQSDLNRVADEFANTADVIVRRNVTRDTPLPLGGELAELQTYLGIKFFHNDISEIRREAWKQAAV